MKKATKKTMYQSVEMNSRMSTTLNIPSHTAHWWVWTKHCVLTSSAIRSLNKASLIAITMMTTTFIVITLLLNVQGEGRRRQNGNCTKGTLTIVVNENNKSKLWHHIVLRRMLLTVLRTQLTETPTTHTVTALAVNRESTKNDYKTNY